MSIMGIAGRRAELEGAAKHLIASELATGVIQGKPPDTYKDYNSNVLKLTMLRRSTLVRSRAFHGKQSTRYKSLEDGAPGALAMVNGDIRKARAEHWENNCCTDEHGQFNLDRCVDNYVSALIGIGIFGALCCLEPAKNRWLTCAECLALVVCGMMFHMFLPRVWRLAYGEYEVPVHVTDSDDFHKWVRSNIWRAKVWLCHLDAPMKRPCFHLYAYPPTIV